MKRGLAALLLLSAAGCGTTANFASREHGPSIYGGIVFDIEQTDSANSCKGLGVVFGILDFPFSLVMDTATLPATLLCEICGWRR